MSGSMMGLMIEGLVAVLLIVTIGYCVLLNQRLKRLRADESALRETIVELVRATEIAERAIEGLRQSAAECDHDLTTKLRQADLFCRTIEKQVDAGGKVLNRLARISELARGRGLVEREAAPAGRQPAAPVAQPQATAPAAPRTAPQAAPQAVARTVAQAAPHPVQQAVQPGVQTGVQPGVQMGVQVPGRQVPGQQVPGQQVPGRAA